MASTNSSTNASVDDEEGGNSGGVVFSDVPSPHAVSVNVVAGAVDGVVGPLVVGSGFEYADRILAPSVVDALRTLQLQDSAG